VATFRQLYTYTVLLNGARIQTFTSKPAAEKCLALHPGSSLEESKGKVQAIIRRKGYKPLTASLDNMTKARRWAGVQEADMAKGVYRDIEACELSVRELMQRYELTFTAKKPTAQRERNALKNIYRLLGDRLVPVTGTRDGELSRRDIRDYVKIRRQEGVVSDTIRKELNPLSNCLNVASDAWEDVPELINVVQKAKAILRLEKDLEPGVRRERRVWQEEIDVILGHGLRSFYAPLAFTFAYNTGMRRSEICQALAFETWFRVVDAAGSEQFKTRAYLVALHFIKESGREDLRVVSSPNRRVSYLHRHERTLYLPAECTKTNEERYVYLTDEALQVLDALPPSADGRLFVTMPDTLTNWIGRRTAAKKIADLTWHDTRHEALSRFAEMGMPLERISSYSGHQDWDTLKRYLHPSRLITKRDPLTGVVIDADAGAAGVRHSPLT
jgi:integrase